LIAFIIRFHIVPGLNREREVVYTALLDSLILSLTWFSLNGFATRAMPDFVNDLTAGITASSLMEGMLSGGIHLVFWLAVFSVFGLYRQLFLISRLDEFVRVVKAAAGGAAALLLIRILFPDDPSADIIAASSLDVAASILPYTAAVAGGVAINRFVIRTIQRRYALKGKGLHRAVIVGTGKTARSVSQELEKFKTMGMQVVGHLHVIGHAHANGATSVQDASRVNGTTSIDELDHLGTLEDMPRLIRQLGVREVIVAIEPEQRDHLVDIISRLDYPEVSLKLMPDFHQLVGGLAKTNQIFGLPLVEIMSSPMPYWERVVKRLMDIAISAVMLIVLSPLMLVLTAAVRLTSNGPAVYRQERVGRDDQPFTMYKFRTMVENAESESGPVWAVDDDPRITPLGRFMRKTRLDELPQFLNVLRGDMSLVGPRPERPFFVERFKKEIPLYGRRLRVRPGITGWAQVKWKYDSTFDDVVEKTKFDLFYVENLSLRMDFKILINTILTVVTAKGR
jgi:exopolysaccharide biosynthesis polyprenyl glycosylphosphotransferase